MKERPILFSGPMVRAIMEGRKTMTRRIVKNEVYSIDIGFSGPIIIGEPWEKNKAMRVGYSCPYGDPCDRLWVRETWSVIEAARTPGDEIPDYVNYLYRANFSDESAPTQWGGKWHPSIFMPRAASRILLEITNVRVERLQDITEEDAQREGVEPLFLQEEIHKPHYMAELDLDPMPFKNYTWHGMGGGDELTGNSSCVTAKESFQSLWYSIHSRKSWEQNPWVWVVEFKRI